MTELPTTDLPAYLVELEDELMAFDPASDAMLLSEIDGFLTAIVLNPEPSPAEAWLPLVWTGGEDDGVAPDFESEDHKKRVEKLVLQHRDHLDDILRTRPEEYGPLFDVEDEDDILWEIWVDGFERGLQFHTESWNRLAQESNKASDAFGLLTVLSAVNHGDSGLSQEKLDELTAMAPSMIPLLVLVINAWRLGTLDTFDELDQLDELDLDRLDDDDIDWDDLDEEDMKELEETLFNKKTASPGLTAPQAPASATKTGRNDPCPCGSGKKYKHCCGRN